MGEAEVVTRAPGRANLMGEHTDYNEGFVLPIAIDLATYVIGKRDPGTITLTSSVEPGSVEVDLSAPRMPTSGWARYVSGVALSLKDAGVALEGVRGSVISEVPMGAGLSSSAALEVAVALAITKDEISSADLAVACRRAENEYVGVASGIMDQLTSAAARAGNACLIDCRTNTITYVPWPESLQVLIIDSGAERRLDSSAFNDRVEECGRAATALGATTLRDVTASEIAAARGRVDDVLLRRAQHVVSENSRTIAAAHALEHADDNALRDLFDESHRSYASDFEASTAEIDRLVEIARETPGIVASRLTGGGWGGCTINLVHSDAEAALVAGSIVEQYERDTKHAARWWVTGAAAGATRLI
jgi:galactokinase